MTMRDDEPDPTSIAALCLALIAALCVCAAATADGQENFEAKRESDQAHETGTAHPAKQTRPTATAHPPARVAVTFSRESAGGPNALRTTREATESNPDSAPDRCVQVGREDQDLEARGRVAAARKAQDGAAGARGSCDASQRAGVHSEQETQQVPSQGVARSGRRADARECEGVAAGARGTDAGDSARVPLGVELLAWCMWAEASGKGATDHAAIAHAIGRQAARAGRSYADQLVAYCHGIRGGAARVTAERARFPRLAAEVDARAAAYFAGELPDPCPGAMHWGGYHADVDRARIDAAVASGRLERVECSAPTRNWFGREVRR